MANRERSRIYTRRQGGETRYYGDFRAYADVEGGREALIPKGQRRATTDPTVAAKLYAERLAELDAKRRNRHLHGIEKEEALKAYAAYHLKQKAASRDVTATWLEQEQRHLTDAVAFFGAGTDLAAITPEEHPVG